MIKVNNLKCTGCGACVQVCPKKCISFKTLDFGHIFPEINKNDCINCHLCEKVCPVDNTLSVNRINPRFYAVVNRNTDLLFKSTSGGFFSSLAIYVLDNGGTVFGCAFNAEQKAMHIRIDKESDLHKIMGSKYVQSDTNASFIKVKEDLMEGRIVLFTGTPCQIAGLRLYLKNKEFDNLILADVVCHGVGSQKYFDSFLNYKAINKNKIISINFRDKIRCGWSCNGSFEYKSKDKKITKTFYNYNNYYYHYFLSGYIYRESCYTCDYANLQRISDLTMGDFWGIEKYSSKYNLDTKNGCSLVIVNTKKGERIFDKLKNNLFFCETLMDEATLMNHQLTKPSCKPKFYNYLKKEFEMESPILIQKNFKKRCKKQICFGRIKRCVPINVRMYLRRFL